MEARNWTMDQILNLTLPQLAIACTNSEQVAEEGWIDNPTPAKVEAAQRRLREQADRIVALIEAGVIQ